MCNATCQSQEIVVAGGKSGAITVFAGQDPTKLIDVDQIRLGSPLMSMSLSANFEEILTVTAEGSMLRVKTKQLAHTVLSQHPSGAMTHVSFPYGSNDHFLTCSRDSAIRLWDLNDYLARVVCGGRAYPVPSCAVGSADIIVGGYEDGTLRCYDTVNGDGLWKVDNAHKGGVTTINLASNMRFVVTGGNEGDLRV